MRKVLIPVAALAVILALGLLGGYVYYFSGLRTAPKPLVLATPTPGSSPAASATATGLAGTWTVAAGSVAGYRVKEKFAGQTSNHEAVARTSSVTGGLSVSGAPGRLQATGPSIAVKLAGLQSVDQVAGFNVSNRDRIVSQTLSVQQFPDATFKAASFALPAGLESGQPVTIGVPGQLTVHGVTKDVTATVQAQLNGDKVQVAGSIPTAMTDFGITPPQVPFTVAQPQVMIEFQLILARAG